MYKKFKSGTTLELGLSNRSHIVGSNVSLPRAPPQVTLLTNYELFIGLARLANSLGEELNSLH